MQEIEQNRQAVIQRFVAVARADERVVAAFLGGSYAREATDAYSDIDFGLITKDEAYDDFFAGHQAFIRLLGEPIFLEVFSDSGFDSVFFTFPEGVECELVLGRESRFTHMHVGAYKVLLDTKGCLSGAVFPRPQVAQSEQMERLRSSISWFWHDLCHHFITPLARGQMWSAYGGLQDLRLACVNLARLSENFSAPPEGYEKVEQAVPVEQLAPLETTCCSLEREAMIQAAFALVRFYQELAVPLAHAYAIAYPADLAQVMSARLERLVNA
jgi:predicted nucleotidyltransferase